MTNTATLRDVDAEAAVLGALLLAPSPEASHKVRELLPSAEAFTEAPHRALYRGWLALNERGVTPDHFALRDELQRQGSWAEVPQGFAHLSGLADGVSSAAQVVAHAEIVRDRWLRRGLHSIASRAQAKAADLGVPIADAYPETVTDLVSATLPLVAEAPTPVGALVFDALQRIEAQDRCGDALEGVSLGLRDLDALLGGAVRGRLLVIAGRPGQGKSALGLHLALSVAAQAVGTVYFLSLEMSRLEITQRAVGSVADVPLRRMNGQRLTNEEFARLTAAAGTVSEYPLVIDTHSRTPGQLRLALQHYQAVSGQPLALVVVDYLTLMRWPHKTETRDLEIGKLTHALKLDIARDLDVPVVCLTQLRRIPEKRDPILSDLRESGNIEQDADQVVMLRYDGADDGIGATAWGAATRTELHIRKNRHGPMGKCDAYYDRRTQRWDDFSFRPAAVA